MYKAIHNLTGEEIIILNPTWLKRIDALREMDHADVLVCQGCRQPLRVKAGEMKRWHFAHKYLKACSYGSESPGILNARAVLYNWLLKRFRQGVTVEKQIEGAVLPRPVDCWVESGAGTFAYWIIETGIKLEPREAIRAAFEKLGVKIHFVFLRGMLHEEKQEFHSLLLTPTERAFLQSTPYDAAAPIGQVASGLAEPGRTIHYLDADQSALTTFRGLSLFHRPNWFKGLKKTSSLDALRVNRKDGEFIHPGEDERLGALQQKQQRQQQKQLLLAEKRQRYQAREAAWEERLEERKSSDPIRRWPEAPRSVVPRPVKNETQGPIKALPCVFCGQITVDYWNTFVDDSGRRLCRCRECLERGIS